MSIEHGPVNLNHNVVEHNLQNIEPSSLMEQFPYLSHGFTFPVQTCPGHKSSSIIMDHLYFNEARRYEFTATKQRNSIIHPTMSLLK